jgi:hypothetical protein
MFVQVALAVEGDSDSLSLLGIAPTTLYFSDRPERVVGHVTTAQFLDQWFQGENSFAANPPNAVCSFFEGADQEPSELIVVLAHPVVSADTLRYGIEILGGEIPVRGGACTLFIDPLRRPLCPKSVAGMQRPASLRSRRRLL